MWKNYMPYKKVSVGEKYKAKVDVREAILIYIEWWSDIWIGIWRNWGTNLVTGRRKFETEGTENAVVWGQEQEGWCACGRLS